MSYYSDKGEKMEVGREGWGERKLENKWHKSNRWDGRNEIGNLRKEVGRELVVYKGRERKHVRDKLHVVVTWKEIFECEGAKKSRKLLLQLMMFQVRWIFSQFA